ncbi:hypothetical protein V6N11_075825 [Hibiscus sabdariffa]|uniref:MLO-like protein n=1 Tax=Hibiscus sabdariffa TaxID=183260 RepID=A0ABR2Q4R5_9ROSI
MEGERVMAATESPGERKLDQTPTWAVAGVCAVIIIISITLEKVLHKLGTWFTERHKKALFEALDKKLAVQNLNALMVMFFELPLSLSNEILTFNMITAELMILGFISLLLTFSQNYIARICIPKDVANTMLPCRADVKEDTSKDSEEHRRRLLWSDRRILASVSSAPKCEEGQEPLISVEGLHELHILIFFLAVFHVLYSFVTMMFGRLKIRGWKKWEQETLSHDYEFTNDPSRFRLTHETSFVKAHTSFWTRIPFFFYIGCFFRQFFKSVGRVDYLTLRNGFINVHLAPGSKFNFQKYIKRSLEDDFKIVVGVSPMLWASFVVYLLLNVKGWQALFWASLIPLIIILAVGTELQAILTKMALEITERHAVVQGMPLVQASDKYFWFGRPQLVLHLIHFALFQYSFGMKSCFHANLNLTIVKISLGVGALLLCSYITLPLYALVTQMGSHMKKSIFDEQTSKALKNWHMAAKKRRGNARKSPTRVLGGSASPSSTLHSPKRSLRRFKTTGHSTRSSYTIEDHNLSDLEAEPLTPAPTHDLTIRVDHDERAAEIYHVEERHEDDFSFAKPAPGKEP